MAILDAITDIIKFEQEQSRKANNHTGRLKKSPTATEVQMANITKDLFKAREADIKSKTKALYDAKKAHKHGTGRASRIGSAVRAVRGATLTDPRLPKAYGGGQLATLRNPGWKQHHINAYMDTWGFTKGMPKGRKNRAKLNTLFNHLLKNDVIVGDAVGNIVELPDNIHDRGMSTMQKAQDIHAWMKENTPKDASWKKLTSTSSMDERMKAIEDFGRFSKKARYQIDRLKFSLNQLDGIPEAPGSAAPITSVPLDPSKGTLASDLETHREFVGSNKVKKSSSGKLKTKVERQATEFLGNFSEQVLEQNRTWKEKQKRQITAQKGIDRFIKKHGITPASAVKSIVKSVKNNPVKSLKSLRKLNPAQAVAEELIERGIYRVTEPIVQDLGTRLGRDVLRPAGMKLDNLLQNIPKQLPK